MEKTASLHYQDGPSDKVYFADLKEKDGGWIVQFQYGRRGSTLTSGYKIETPVNYEKAEKVFQKLINEKIGKGYKETGETVSYEVPAERIQTNLVAQLLNEIDKADIQRLIEDDSWYLQEKYDGKRMITNVSSNKIIANNRKGQVCGYPKVFDQLMAYGDNIFDGEAVGEKYYIFDIIKKDGKDVTSESLINRINMLKSLIKENNENIILAEYAIGLKAKEAMVARVRENNGEGVVFKLSTSQYTPGRPASGGNQMKWKFVETLTAIVSEINLKRSVGLELFDENGQRVFVGNVTITPNFEMPKKGDLVEIRYLYGNMGGSLYQPMYLGIRDDINEEDCLMSQIKYKPK